MHLPLIMSARPQLAVGQLDRSALMDLLRKLDVDGGGVAKFEFVVGMLLQARARACCVATCTSTHPRPRPYACA